MSRTFCPDGTVRAEEVVAAHPEALVVAVHTSDAMEIPDGATLSGTYIGGYPSGTIDRYKFPAQSGVEVNRGLWSTLLPERKNMVVPASLAMEAQSWDPATRLIEVRVRADFYGTLSGDIR